MFERLLRHRYPASLALVSAGVLGLGLLLKPEPKQAPEAVIPESEIARLQALTRRKNLEDTFKYFSGLAQKAAGHMVRIDQADATGVVWDSRGRIVVPALTEGTFSLLTALPAAGAGLQPVRTATGRFEPGSWIVQVSRQANGTHLFTPGILSGTVPAWCGDLRYEEVQTSLPLGPAMLGGGLFDMDGSLAAVITRCGARYTAIAASDIDRALRQAEGLPGRLLQRYGIRVGPLDDTARAHFKTDQGVLVGEVWRGRLADAAGLAPGDIIVELDRAPVKTPGDLGMLAQTAAGHVFALTVRRGGRNVRISLSTVAESQGDRSGLTLQPPARGYAAETVERGSRAYRAGVRAGDRLILIDGRRPAGLAAARRSLSRQNGEPSYLVFERGMRIFGVLL